MIKYNTPQELFTAICNKIRDKTNSNELINHQDIPDKIDNLVDSDIINEYNELLSMINQNNAIIELNNNEIENINICFIECTSLTTIDLPKCATINRYTFKSCNNLITVNLPKCTSIGNSAFEKCNNLITVNLPKCTSIVDNVFSGCTSLTTINLPECTSIGYGAFSDCTNLTTVDLPKCTSIGEYAFKKRTNLTTIDLPECTTLGYQTFMDCTSLTTVNLPKCTSIGASAFYRCTNLTTIILSNNQVATLEDIYAFYNSSITNGTGYIYVPDNLVDSYKTATNWSTYANQIKPISELPSNLKEEYGYE